MNGNTVYAAFVRWNSVAFDESPNRPSVLNSSIVVVRDDNGATGAIKFGALGVGGGGVTVATTQVPFTQTVNTGRSLGNERAGSDLSIAVDPNNKNHVYVAFAEVPGAANSGQMRVQVYESTDGGGSWASKFTTTTNANLRSGIPALAVAADGSVGLQYTAFNVQTNQLEQHFVQTSNNFGSVTDSILERFTNNNVPFLINPYLGDFMDLVAVGNTFYGTFSSSNNLNDAVFPVGLPTFQRNTAGDPSKGTFALLDPTGKPIGFSIDPYFFSIATSVPEPSIMLLLGSGLLGLVALKRRFGSKR